MPKARSWEEVRAEAARRGHINEQRVAELVESSLQEIRAYQLAEIRKGQGTSQEEVAEAMGVSQSRVSRIERGEIGRSELNTIKEYVRALGGKLEIVADFGDQRLVIG